MVISNGNYKKFYVNAQLVHSSSVATIPNDYGVPISIGGIHRMYDWDMSLEGFLGLIDEVQIWSRVLTAEEIQIKMIEQEQLIPVSEEGLLGYWPFDEGIGSVVFDVSGNNGSSTVYGASYTNDTPVTTSLVSKSLCTLVFCLAGRRLLFNDFRVI
jgi:hypothetical protein